MLNVTPQAARPQSELLRALADNISAMLAYWDSSLRCRFANRAYQSWFGVSPEALVGMHIRELLGPLYALNRPYIEAALRGEPQEFEREIPDPAGGASRHSLASYIPDVVGGVVRGFFVLVTDISRIKRAELALRESEERFRLTIDEAPIGMALVASDGRFLRVNRALSEILGYTPDELIGLTFRAITHPADLDADVELAKRLGRGEILRYHLEKRYVRKDGGLVDVLVHRAAVRGPAAGPPLYYITQIEDITERKRLEAQRRQADEELRRSQERFELALQGADLASWDWNVQTGEVIFNPRWALMRGYRPDEIEPHVRSWISGVHPEDLPRVREVLNEHFEGRLSEYETEHRVRTKSGDWLWVLDRGKVFSRDENGKPTRMVGTELDITERKRLEQEQRFLAEVGPALATLDYEGTLTTIAELAVRHLADLCIVDVVGDDAEVRRLKVATRDPSKAWLCDALSKVPLDRSRSHLMRAVLETRRTVLLQHPTPDVIASFAQGEEHRRALEASEIHSLLAVPLLAHDRLLGAIAFVSSAPSRQYGPADVRLAEELGRRAALSIENARLYDAARRATQARDEVLGIVAHDLRNPLNSIVLQAQLLRRQGNAPEQQKGAEKIEGSVRRMNRLIQDLLDVTRMDACGLSVELTRVDSRTVLSDSLEAQRQLAASSSLELRLEAPAALPQIWGDRDRLLQVLENLIGNAVKFTNAGGRVTVGAAPRDGEVLFWVSDTGSGIPESDLPQVFDRFWQARRSRQGGGAGLGLPIVKGIVEAHGGHVWAESKEGLGTTFFFTVPTADRVPGPQRRGRERTRITGMSKGA